MTVLPATDPQQWERHVALADGHMVHIRSIRPEDEALYGRFLAAVTPDDVRMRFLAPMKELSHTLIDRFTHLDYTRAMAFIALDEASGEMLGVARLHDLAGGSAEYAIIVRSDIKSRGLGWQMMHLTIDYARAKGLNRIEGKVLHENTAMLHMCRDLGFEIRIDPAAASVCDVTLKL